jgi:hypothetical protein
MCHGWARRHLKGADDKPAKAVTQFDARPLHWH